MQLLICAALGFSETTHHKHWTASLPVCITDCHWRVRGSSWLKRPAVTLVSLNYCLIGCWRHDSCKNRPNVIFGPGCWRGLYESSENLTESPFTNCLKPLFFIIANVAVLVPHTCTHRLEQVICQPFVPSSIDSSVFVAKQHPLIHRHLFKPASDLTCHKIHWRTFLYLGMPLQQPLLELTPLFVCEDTHVCWDTRGPSHCHSLCIEGGRKVHQLQLLTIIHPVGPTAILKTSKPTSSFVSRQQAGSFIFLLSSKSWSICRLCSLSCESEEVPRGT